MFATDVVIGQQCIILTQDSYRRTYRLLKACEYKFYHITYGCYICKTRIMNTGVAYSWIIIICFLTFFVDSNNYRVSIIHTFVCWILNLAVKIPILIPIKDNIILLVIIMLWYLPVYLVGTLNWTRIHVYVCILLANI